MPTEKRKAAKAGKKARKAHKAYVKADTLKYSSTAKGRKKAKKLTAKGDRKRAAGHKVYNKKK